MARSFSQGGKANTYSTPSDLTVEEQLAAGASVDDLVESGVLYDDYDPDNDPDYLFNQPSEPEEVPKRTMSPEEIEAKRRYTSAFVDLRVEHRRRTVALRMQGLGADSPEYRAMSKEILERGAQLRAERARSNAPN